MRPGQGDPDGRSGEGSSRRQAPSVTSSGSRRQCSWLNGLHSSATSPAAWWVHMTRAPKASSLRAGRTRSIVLQCRASAASQG